MTVDVATAQWLQSLSLVASAASAEADAAWGDLATISEIVSPLALKADAGDEAARQLLFLKFALAVERIDVPGKCADQVGRPLDIYADRAGYENGLRVFAIGAEEQANIDRTVLTVLRRMQ